MARRVLTAIACAFAMSACGGDDPQVPTSFLPINGGSQVTGTVASLVGTSPQVQILDAKGRGIKGLKVRWRVGTNSGGVGNDSTVTDASGIALSGGWTLGTAAGTQTLTATAEGIAPVVFTAQVAPGPAVNLVRLSPEGLQATVGTAVATPPSARAQDAFGNPVSGVAVTFAVTFGGGTIAPAQRTTDANGIATADSWTLGTQAGQQVSRATALNVTQATFSATALAGPPADMVKVVGDNQTGIAGSTIVTAPGVRVVDAFGNPLGNIPVTFTPGSNSGTVTAGAALTDPGTGTAFVGSWILGSAPTQTLVASSSALPGKSATFTATVVSSAFDIQVRFIGTPPSAAIQGSVTRAITKWKNLIVSNSGTTRFTGAAQSCGRSWLPAIDTIVTNLVLYARIGPIDGVGNQLGNANACAIHPSTGLTGIGTMEFDSDDLANLATELVDAVITHEIGHSVGVGSFWNLRALLTDGGQADPIFTGAQARAEFLALGGDRFTGRIVPVENTGGAGTRDVHWRESVFRNELMTGFINQGQNPLSRVTVGSLADLGYTISFAGADSYTFTSFLLSPFGAPTPTIDLGDDIAPLVTDKARGGRLHGVTVSPGRRP